MKVDWKKHEKQFYAPKSKLELVSIPDFKYFTIEGRGNPNHPFFAEYVGVLYSLSYAIKMSPKKGMAPQGYLEYVVYPLEGIWDISEEAKKTYNGTLNKDTLVFQLMIRQPDFVDEKYAIEVIEFVKKKKPHTLLDTVKFETIVDGLCIQMLHEGSFDDEPESFSAMEQFANEAGYARKSKIHREIYLSDARKVAADKLKTVLRFGVEKN